MTILEDACPANSGVAPLSRREPARGGVGGLVTWARARGGQACHTPSWGEICE